MEALTGRFIHITDIHPDTHYRAGATLASGVTKNRTRGGKDKAKEGPLGRTSWISAKGEDIWDETDLKGDEDLAGRWGTGVS